MPAEQKNRRNKYGKYDKNGKLIDAPKEDTPEVETETAKNDPE